MSKYLLVSMYKSVDDEQDLAGAVNFTGYFDDLEKLTVKVEDLIEEYTNDIVEAFVDEESEFDSKEEYEIEAQKFIDEVNSVTKIYEIEKLEFKDNDFVEVAYTGYNSDYFIEEVSYLVLKID